MPNKTFIKRIKEDDKYDFLDLHSELESIRNLKHQRFHLPDRIRDCLSRVYSYKDFEKISNYFLKKGKGDYISQIINNSSCSTLLSNFVEQKKLTIDNRLVKTLYSHMNINTKLEIIGMIEMSERCLTYNISEPNIKILEKCLNHRLEDILKCDFVLRNYYGSINIRHVLSLLIKTSGFIPDSSFDKKYIFETISERKTHLQDLRKKATRGREITWADSKILVFDCLRAYFDHKTTFDYSMFLDNCSVRYSSSARSKLSAFIFADSCSIDKEHSHEFVKSNKMGYETRSLFYDFRVRLGKANPKLSRIARSDGSEESCKSFVIALLASLKMYSDDEILALVAQFTDCKYFEPSVILYRGLPQKYKYLMLSNKHVRRSGQ